jgi:hypothetical protein
LPAASARAEQLADGRQRGGGLVDRYLGRGEHHPRAGSTSISNRAPSRLTLNCAS